MSPKSLKMNNPRDRRGGPGRGHRGGPRRTSSKRFGDKKNSPVKLEKKFSPQSAGKQQFATYATVKDEITLHVQKNFEGGPDLAQCIKEMKKIDLDALEPQ